MIAKFFGNNKKPLPPIEKPFIDLKNHSYLISDSGNVLSVFTALKVVNNPEGKEINKSFTTIVKPITLYDNNFFVIVPVRTELASIDIGITYLYKPLSKNNNKNISSYRFVLSDTQVFLNTEIFENTKKIFDKEIYLSSTELYKIFLSNSRFIATIPDSEYQLNHEQLYYISQNIH